MTHDPMREALEPCPFCNGEAEFIDGPLKERWGVRCKQCDVWRDDRCPEKAEAAELWNTRRLPLSASAPCGYISPRTLKGLSTPEGAGAVVAAARDEVRKLLIEQPEENLDVTEGVLADIDSLTTLTRSDISATADVTDFLWAVIRAYYNNTWSSNREYIAKRANALIETLSACGDGHDSDCATYNEPAYPSGPCNCSAAGGDEASRRDDLALAAKCAGELCDDCPPVGYPTDRTRCIPCPRRAGGDEAKKSEGGAGCCNRGSTAQGKPLKAIEPSAIGSVGKVTPHPAGVAPGPSDPPDRREIVARTATWPAGCNSPGSCERHRECMYVGCVWHGTDINAALDGGKSNG